MLTQFLARYENSPALSEMVERAGGSHDNIVVTGSRSGSTPAVLAVLARRLARPILIVTSSIERAEALTDGLTFFGAQPQLFPSYETLPFETTEPVMHIAAARNRLLAGLAMPLDPSSPPLVVAPVDALCFRCLPAGRLGEMAIDFQWGQSLDLHALAEQLVVMGYRREGLVESPGEFAIRGSIVDLFSPDADWPVRLDLFGDEIEQIREFDPTTQRSRPVEKDIPQVRLLPVGCHAPQLDWLAEGRALASVFELLPPRTLVVMDGPFRTEQRLLHFEETVDRHWRDIHKAREDSEPNPLVTQSIDRGRWILDAGQVKDWLGRFQHVDLADMGSDIDDELVGDRHDPASPAVFTLTAQSFETIPAQFAEYMGMFRERLRRGHWVVVVCDNNGQVMRLDEMFRENEISAVALVGDEDVQTRYALPADPMDGCPDVLLCVGELHEGFHDPHAGVFIVTDREIFGRYKRRHIYRRTVRGKSLANPSEIQRGDYVVHIEHGIGLFEGIRRQHVDGRMAEFLELIYQDGNKLLVPVEKLHQVQKYAAADGKQPTLDRLGSKKWASRRKKSMEAVRKMAGELLELYARREAAEGFSFGEDTIWQQEFEASFIYQETPDQLKAIEDVKKVMRNHRPMDRLVCGDVGYGKTEVAIRAAFKALTEGKQVALLAPTTLLVSQHYNNFCERFADYPFKIEMLSRFRSPKQQRETLAALKRGEAQMIIGTHRILSRDVQFKDLGLLIVDEEQRFGVAQKEKIKSLRADVDALTLTATPIPRTLYMALAGVRDLSLINTPPANRHPIKTRTIRFDREQIEEAILRELNRGGQVYFVHNRVQSIQEITHTIHEVVPQARIIFAHGQMDEHELEKIMIDFIAGKYDILISTTIIENGIDIPNVNTIIINRADTFGLAQLYQLRGRVGRDVRQAYAYLILPPGQAITPTALKRLEALEEFTDLGVGFSIAMRDMEIRGTGNILGAEQHGAISDVGFELYCRLLEEAVAELKGGIQAEPLWPVEIKWPVEQILPEEYIPIESQRIRFYKDLAGARTLDDVDLLVEELVDRYGVLPPESVNLVHACRLKISASPWRVDTIRPGADDTVRITVPQFSVELAAAMAENARRGKRDFTRLRRLGTQIILHVRADEDEDVNPEKVLEALCNYFETLPDFTPPADEEPSLPDASSPYAY